MSRTFPIIDRSVRRVNGRRSIGALPWIVLALAGLACAGCGKERAAERAYEDAHRLVEKGEIDAAVREFERIAQRYPRTATAERARDEATLYRGLSEAVEDYPERRVRDTMILTARAVYRYRSSRGTWPRRLEDLRPRFLEEDPRDPWGRAFVYRVTPGGRGYVLATLGSDGQPGGEGEARDWYIEDRKFVRQPSVAVP